MRRNIIIIGISCLLLFAFPLTAKLLRTEVVNDWEKRITVISPFSDNNYWEKICTGAIEEGALCGMDVKCVSSADNDETKVSENLKSAVYSDVDGIIVYGVDGSSDFMNGLSQAWEKEIPVVLVDSNVDTERKLCYVGTNNYESGWNAGIKMAEDCGKKGKILVVVSSKKTNNQRERVAGFEDALQNCPEMEIVEILEGSSNMMQGQKRIEDALDRNEDVDGIFCAEGITSYAALKVMQERSGEASRIPVTVYEYGEVLAKGLENGYISTAIVQAPLQMGKMAVQVLDAYLENGTVPEEDIFTDTKLFRRDNLEDGEDFINWDGDIEWHYY